MWKNVCWIPTGFLPMDYDDASMMVGDFSCNHEKMVLKNASIYLESAVALFRYQQNLLMSAWLRSA